MTNTTTTIELDDLTIHAHSDELSHDWEEQQSVLRACAFDAWLDEQEKNFWENLAKKSEGFSCQH